MKKLLVVLLVVLCAATTEAKWPAVNTTVPGTNGQCLINDGGLVGATDCSGGGGGNSPTFSTSVTTPLLIGGTAVGSTITLKSTSATGTTDAIIFQVGANGATEAGRFLHNGHLRLGGSSDLGFATINDSTNFQTNLYVNKDVTGNLAASAVPSYGQQIFMVNSATNPAIGQTITTEALHVNVIHGTNSVLAEGTTIGVNVALQVLGSASPSGGGDNEYAPFIGVTRVDLGTGYTNSGVTGNIWMTDFGIHTGIANRPNSVQGAVMFVNNYYNGSPVAAASCAICAITFPGTGSGADATHAAATTFANDVGVLVSGKSGVVGVNAGVGWTEGIRVGGSGSIWNPGSGSRIGTGLHVRDFETAGILIDNRTAASVGPALVVNDSSQTQGSVVVGAAVGTSPYYAVEITSPSTSDVQLLKVKAAGATSRLRMLFESLQSSVEMQFLHIGNQAWVLGLDGSDNSFALSSSDDNFGAGTKLKVTTAGQVLVTALKTTGAATGKTVVCVDTGTGQLYASTSGVACAD